MIVAFPLIVAALYLLLRCYGPVQVRHQLALLQPTDWRAGFAVAAVFALLVAL